MDRFKFNSKGIELAIHNKRTGQDVVLTISNPDREVLDNYKRSAERYEMADKDLTERVKKSKKKGLRGAIFWGLIYPKKLKTFRQSIIDFVASMLERPSKEVFEALSQMNEGEFIRLIYTIIQIIEGQSLTYLNEMSYQEISDMVEKKTIGYAT